MELRVMEITTRIGCKLNCRFCPQNKLINEYCKHQDAPTIMSFETFKRCIDKIPTNVEIDFSGMCEPWLNKECTQMLKYTIDKGHAVSIYTTLVGMNINDYEYLKSIHTNSLVLHIPDEEGNSRFDFDETYREILFKALDDVISGELEISNFSCHGEVHHLISELVEKSGKPVLSEMYDRAGNIEDLDANTLGKKREGVIVCTYCNGNGLSRNVLLPNGKVLLCCMDYGMEYLLGDLLIDDYRTISEGKNKLDFRKRLQSEAKGDILCRHCVVSEEKWKWVLSKFKRLFFK